MDDALKGAALGVVTLALFHWVLTEHARHVTEGQVRKAFGPEGHIHVSIQPDAPFGLLWGGVRQVEITGDELNITRLPFARVVGYGWTGTVRHLVLHLRDFRLNGYHIARLDTEVPGVQFDAGDALWRGEVVTRGAGMGHAVVELGAADLGAFLNAKYHSIVTNGVVNFDPPGLTIHAESGLLGAPTPFTVYGTLLPRAGRYVDVTTPRLLIDGRDMGPAFALGLTSRLNPVLDIQQDLHLGDYLYVESVKVSDDRVDVYGAITIPGLTAKPGKEN